MRRPLGRASWAKISLAGLVGVVPGASRAGSTTDLVPQTLRANSVHITAASDSGADVDVLAEGEVMVSGSFTRAQRPALTWLVCCNSLRLLPAAPGQPQIWQLHGDVRLQLGDTTTWAGHAQYLPAEGLWQLDEEVVSMAPGRRVAALQVRLGPDPKQIAATGARAWLGERLPPASALRPSAPAAAGSRCPLPARPQLPASLWP